MKLLTPVLLVLLFSFLIFKKGFAQTPRPVTKNAVTDVVTVSGMVLDGETNAPLPNVTISNDSKKALGLSGMDGSFSISATRGSHISFSTVSYTLQRLPVIAAAINKRIMLAQDSK